jgi:hypothetical protein
MKSNAGILHVKQQTLTFKQYVSIPVNIKNKHQHQLVPLQAVAQENYGRAIRKTAPCLC